jgi:hypothetical protein
VRRHIAIDFFDWRQALKCSNVVENRCDCVFAGDTLYAESQVLAKRVSASNPLNGIVSVETRGLVRGATVIEFERSFLMRIGGAIVY